MIWFGMFSVGLKCVLCVLLVISLSVLSRLIECVLLMSGCVCSVLSFVVKCGVSVWLFVSSLFL